jgi:L-seryl-tRNA(Ser) seleniumtransferase
MVATFESLGIKKVINASGNNSQLGSSIISPEVLYAMNKASKVYVDMDELHMRSGEFIAQITGAEAGLVTTGASGGLLLAAAACVTGINRDLMLELPQAAKGKEIIVQKRHRTGYDQAIRTSGVSLIEVGLFDQTYPEQIENSINGNTVAILFTFGEKIDRNGEVPLKDVIKIAKKHKIPIIVDGSVINFPFIRLKDCITMGVDLLVTSGGKHIFGPPGTGFLCGRKDLVEACRLQAGPGYGIGRPLKIGKEEIIGLITALEIYIKKDYKVEVYKWNEKIHYLVSKLNELPNIEVTQTEFDEVDRPVPRARLFFNERKIGHNAYEIAKCLRSGEHQIWVQEFELSKGVILLNPVCLANREEELIIQEFQNLWRLWSLL